MGTIPTVRRLYRVARSAILRRPLGLPEMVRMAGSEELFAEIGEPFMHICWEEVFEAIPEVILLMPCGFNVTRTLREVQALPNFPAGTIFQQSTTGVCVQ